MPSFYRILTYLFLGLYVCAILFIAVNADKVLSMGNDFQAQYGAARLQMMGKNVYSLSEEAAIQTVATGRKTSSYDAVPYINSPLTLLLLTPLGALSFAGAYMAWASVLYLLLLLSIYLLHRLYDVVAREKKSVVQTQSKDLFVLVALVMHPVVVALFAGQLSLLLLVGMLSTYFFLKSKRDIWAGISLALLFVKPYLLVAPLLYLVYKRKWYAVVSCTLVLCALYAVVWIWLGSGPFVRYAELGRSLFWIGDEPMKIHLSRQIGLRGLVYVLSGSSLFTVAQLVVWVVLVAAASVFVFLNLSKQKEILGQDWAWVSVFMVLSAVHMHGHDGIILLFPLLVWYVHSGIAQWKKTAALVVLTISLLPIIFYAGPAVSALLFFALVYRYFSSTHHARTL